MSMRKGVVSLYVVIFTTMLLSIISIGFMRIMMGEQAASRNQDLSNSAFDSAMAGVEDGKVVALAFHECVGLSDNATRRGMSCGNVRRAVEERGCDTVLIARGESPNPERQETGLDQGFAGNDPYSEWLDQAYTCVVVRSTTQDFLGQISPQMPSIVIPLRFERANLDQPNYHEDNTITSVIVRWWHDEDNTPDTPVVRANGRPAFRGNCNNEGQNCFANQLSWGANPPVIRWQLINPMVDMDTEIINNIPTVVPRPDSRFSLDRLNQPFAHASLFLVPMNTGGARWGLGNNRITESIVGRAGQSIMNTAPHNQIEMGVGSPLALTWSIDSPQSPAGIDLGGHTPFPVLCEHPNPNDNRGQRGFHCAVEIGIPGGIPANSPATLLRLTAYYGVSPSTISVEGVRRASGGTGIIVGQTSFESVQLEIDSTGRASELFRRVITRVNLTDSYFPFPEYSLELTGNGTGVDKNFLVWPGGSQPL